MDKFSLMIKRKGQITFELHSEPEATFIPRIGEKVELKIGSTGYFFEIIDVIYPLSIGANIAEIYALEIDTTTDYLAKLNS